MAEKKTLSAKEILADISAGATDEFLITKYGLSEKGLKSLFQKLIAAKLLPPELHRRRDVVDAVEIIEENASPKEKSLDVSNKLGEKFKISKEDLLRIKTASLTDINELMDKHNLSLSDAKELLKGLSLSTSSFFAETTNKIKEGTKKLTDRLLEEKPQRQPDVTKTSGPPSESESAPPPLSSDHRETNELAKRLSQLKEAFEAGLLSPAEFENKKTELTQPPELSSKLNKLREMLDAGILNQEEYNQKKSELSRIEGVLPPLTGIDSYYLEIFKEVEAGKKPRFNWYAFLWAIVLTPLWYFYKGMWRKGLVYWVIALIASILFELASGRWWIAGEIVIPISVGSAANWDYYLYKIHGQEWWSRRSLMYKPWREDLPRRLIQESSATNR